MPPPTTDIQKSEPVRLGTQIILDCRHRRPMPPVCAGPTYEYSRQWINVMPRHGTAPYGKQLLFAPPLAVTCRLSVRALHGLFCPTNNLTLRDRLARFDNIRGLLHLFSRRNIQLSLSFGVTTIWQPLNLSSTMATVRHARREGKYPEAQHESNDTSLTQIIDAPVILELIQALADYEKEPDAVKATVQTLENTIAFAPSDSPGNDATVPKTEPISPTRPSRCLLLFDPEGKAVGMALYFYNYSTWRSKPGIYLEDLFVQPSARGAGYGKRLLVELAKQVVAMEGGRLDWVVLKWNEPSIKFYRSIGAQSMDDWMGMRVEGAALEKLAKALD